MKRRPILRTVATAGLAGLAGCLDLDGTLGVGEDARTDAPQRTTTSERPEPPLAESGFPETICEESRKPGALLEIVDPAFASEWPGDVDATYGSDGVLQDDEIVVGRRGGDRPRAYPISVLWTHEVVEDEYADESVLVTYCSICRSGMVASRVVDDVERSFRATGLLWQPERLDAAAAEDNGRSFGASQTDASVGVRARGNLVLADEQSGSYWSQLLARAICGPLEGTGLEILPSTVTTWGEWRRSHPETDVLLPPPYSGVDDTGRERRD